MNLETKLAQLSKEKEKITPQEKEEVSWNYTMSRAVSVGLAAAIAGVYPLNLFITNYLAPAMQLSQDNLPFVRGWLNLLGIPAIGTAAGLALYSHLNKKYRVR